ncbi:MAG: hypothetical protein H0U97_12085 [Gammaproteobacteria bacterium]|nr:hypothetical protein [Gammaproteobacteria bacterium]
MAVIQGIKEKVHSPLYDSLNVEPEKQLRDVENSSTLKFFVNVQGKTKLETNLQSASLLPHYNTFEARAMRVVISDLPPEFPEEPKAKSDEDLAVTDQEDNGVFVDDDGLIGIVKVDAGVATIVASEADFELGKRVQVFADIAVGLDRLMELVREDRDSEDGFAALIANEDGVTLKPPTAETKSDTVADFGGVIFLSVAELEGLIIGLDKKAPPKEQLRPNDGAGTIIGKFIYNTVTTLFVGEKIMIQMPTWFFPAGAGPFSESARFTTHGEPDPMATFRFPEPIYIDKQQNFRVEIEVPDSDTLKELQKIYGPLNIWVVLDGYMTRDVQ